MSSPPWNDWYHCMGHTYGTWLPGSPKGFRTRHHREHVDGDYKNPPPAGKYEARYERARALMKRSPVYLTVEQRRRAAEEFARSLRKWNIEVLIISIDRVHFHLLARLPDHNPRKWVGLAKKESSAYMKQDGLAPQGGLWAVRFQSLPICDRSHQVEVFGYIHDHAHVGASLWRFDRT